MRGSTWFLGDLDSQGCHFIPGSFTSAFTSANKQWGKQQAVGKEAVTVRAQRGASRGSPLLQKLQDFEAFDAAKLLLTYSRGCTRNLLFSMFLANLDGRVSL